MTGSALIRGGQVYDGSGAPPQPADLLIQDGRVRGLAPWGQLAAPPGVEAVDATGCWVTPGFIDTHTHYDAELALAPGLNESVRHGVTSVVLGCCSVSFVASEPEDCADLFTRVEAVPREVVLPLLRQIKRWDRPSGWRAWVDAHPLGPNVASFLGHSDLRVATLGLLPAVDPAVKPDGPAMARMEGLLEEALDCGFLGLSCMRNPWDRLDGDRAWSSPLPSTFARGAERRAFSRLLRRRGAILQTAPNLVTRVNVLGMVWGSGGRWRRPLKTTVITMMDLKADPWVYGLTATLAWVANRLLGGDFRWQSPPVPFDLYYDGMDSVLFEEFPTGQAIRNLMRDHDARKAMLLDPSFRAQFRRELGRRLAPKVWHRDLGDARILEAPDPALVGLSFAEVAAARGADPVDTFLDLMVEHDRALRWHSCLANHRPEVLAKILRNPDTLMSFADSGAHLRSMAFYNFPVRMLKRVRDAELAGAPIMPIAQAIHRLTGEPAGWFGLDAGLIRAGGRADVVVLDPARLDEQVEQVDLRSWAPGYSFDRMVNKGEAVRHVWVNGARVVEDAETCPSLGRVRSGQFLEARP